MIRERLFILLGCLCVLLGGAGVVMPGLPTTPFLLAASWFFFRSSSRLKQRLLSSRLGDRIRDYERRGGMHPHTKATAVVLMSTMVTCSIILFIHNALADWIVGIGGTIGCLIVIFKVPTAR